MQGELVVAGITIDRQGQVTVQPHLNELLCELAISLQEDHDLPVDVEHVLAALVMATRSGEITPGAVLAPGDQEQRGVIARYVQLIFRQFGGKVCGDA